MSALAVARFQTVFDVSRETLERLLRYEVLLKKWNTTINLISKSTLGEIWSRHFLDSAQLFDFAPSDTYMWTDLGSGGGFPGLVIAILSKEKRPKQEVILIESDHRKAVFLAVIQRELDLNAKVITQPIDVVSPLNTHILSARALAPLENLLTFCERHLRPYGNALFPKGERWEEELAAAQKNWSFACEVRPSISSRSGVILKISGVKRV